MCGFYSNWYNLIDNLYGFDIEYIQKVILYSCVW